MPARNVNRIAIVSTLHASHIEPSWRGKKILNYIHFLYDFIRKKEKCTRPIPPLQFNLTYQSCWLDLKVNNTKKCVLSAERKEKVCKKKLYTQSEIAERHVSSDLKQSTLLREILFLFFFIFIFFLLLLLLLLLSLGSDSIDLQHRSERIVWCSLPLLRDRTRIYGDDSSAA